jgi:hypothetical protein
MPRTLAASLLLLGLAASVVAGEKDEKPDLDPRIAFLIERLEDVRGARFREPPVVQEVGMVAIRTHVARHVTLRLEERRRLLAPLLALLEISGEPAEGMLVDALAGQAAAVYDEVGRRILIHDRSEPFLLMHELVHALQDQRFDLAAMLAGDRTLDEHTVRQMLVEGEATWLGVRYGVPLMNGPWKKMDGASPLPGSASALEERIEGARRDLDGRIARLAALRRGDDRKAYLEELEGAAALLAGLETWLDSRSVLEEPAEDRYPWSTWSVVFAESRAYGTGLEEIGYYAGAAFVDHVLRTAGWERVDALFRSPPASSEQMLHPDREDPPTSIRLPDLAPVLGSGWKRTGETVGGEAMLRGLLAREAGLARAIRASIGWDGDRIAAYRHDDARQAVAWVLTFDSERDARQAREAFGQWGRRTEAALSSRLERRDLLLVLGLDESRRKAVLGALGAFERRLAEGDSGPGPEDARASEAEEARSLEVLATSKWDWSYEGDVLEDERAGLRLVLPRDRWEPEKQGKAQLIRHRMSGAYLVFPRAVPTAKARGTSTTRLLGVGGRKASSRELRLGDHDFLEERFDGTHAGAPIHVRSLRMDRETRTHLLMLFDRRPLDEGALKDMDAVLASAAVLAEKPRENPQPEWRFPSREEFERVAKRLEAISPPPDSDREACLAYVRAILEVVEEESCHPGKAIKRGLAAVGPRRVDVLLEAFRSVPGHLHDNLVRVLHDLLRDEHRDLILASLESQPYLARFVRDHDWVEAGREVLLRPVLRAKRRQLPNSWIEAVVELGDQRAVEGLRLLLLRGPDPWGVYERVYDLEDIHHGVSADLLWLRTMSGKSPETGKEWQTLVRVSAARVAIRFGNVDALICLAKDTQNVREPAAAEEVREFTDSDSERPLEEIHTWCVENRDRLEYDEEERVYRVRER